MRIAISSGHGTRIRGARGDPVPPQLDEVDCAIDLMARIKDYLQTSGVEVQTYTDTVSTSQGENLDRIINWHNDSAFGGGEHDYDLSIHFNAYSDPNANGTEMWWYSQEQLATELSAAVATAGGFKNRGAKWTDNLAFLNGTRERACLLEICFVTNTPDSEKYRAHTEEIAAAIAAVMSGEEVEQPPETEQPPPSHAFATAGRCSWFGGKTDTGVAPDEDLAFIFSVEAAPHLFYEQQPPSTSGLARRLNSEQVNFIACRFDYDAAGTSKADLANPHRLALVRGNGREAYAWCADWGPHVDTGRVCDLSKALMLQLFETLDATDEEVEVIYPAPASADSSTGV
jgi:N-acetylmuramoyl-L-alanine amidase